MKIVKYFFVIISVFIILLPSSACGTYEPDELPFRSANMQRNVPSGNFVRYGEDILFFGLDGQDILYRMNTDTMEVRLFCDDPTCNHATDKCKTGGVKYNLESYDGVVYAANNRGQILKLEKDRFQLLTKESYGSFFHADHHIYVLTYDGAVQELDMKGRFLRTISDENSGFGENMSDGRIYGNGVTDMLMLDTRHVPSRPEVIYSDLFGINDGLSFFLTDTFDAKLYRYDKDQDQGVLLSEKPVFQASLNFDDEYLYFRYYINHDMYGEECGTVYRMRKDGTDLQRIAELPGVVRTIYTVPDSDWVYADLYGDTGSESTYSIFAVKKDGSELKRLELP